MDKQLKVKQEKKKVKLNKDIIKKRILPTIVFALLIPLVICISVPFEIYANNLDEFVFTLNSFLPCLALMLFALFAVIFSVTLFLPQRAYRIVVSILISISLMFFVQGTYLNGNMNTLQGDNMGGSEISIGAKILNSIIWVLVIGGAITLSIIKDKKGIVSIVTTILTLIIVSTQLITPISLSLTNDKIFLDITERLEQTEAEKKHCILTDENLFDISKTNNIYYFCIDRFDEEYAEKAYNKYKTIYNELTGFTWFQDNISVYGHTYPAVTQMLTRVDYSAEEKRLDYFKRAYENNDTLKVLSENGYDINIHTQNYYAFNDAVNLPDYIKNKDEAAITKVENKFKLSLSMIGLALYRVSPTVCKGIYANINSSTCNEQVVEYDKDGNKKFSIDMKYVYDYVSAQKATIENNKVFNFIHLAGCHEVTYDENWNKNTKPQHADVSIAVKSSFDIINKYIQAMKSAGVYDNATIIITGDHCSPVNDFKDLNGPRLTALFVKPSNSNNQPLQISQAQTSHDNIWATIMKSENITSSSDYGKSVFDIPENENQTRRYIWQTYALTLDIYTYEITGKAKDFSNWRRVDHKHYDKFLMD